MLKKMRVSWGWGDLFGSVAASRMSFCSGGNIFPEASPFPLLFLIESRPNSSPDALILFFLLSSQLISAGISKSSSLLTPSRRGVSQKRNARARSREKKALPTPPPPDSLPKSSGEEIKFESRSEIQCGEINRKCCFTGRKGVGAA